MASKPLRSNMMVLGLAAALVLVGTSSAPASAVASPTSPDCARIQVAAHRGVHDSRHTENTIGSARLAAAVGADVLEGDMRLTRDHVWVMMHDASVTRTTNGHGEVARLRYRQIKRLRTNDGVRGGVPTVDADLSVMDAHPSMKVQFEVKSKRVSKAALRQLLGIFARHHLLNRLTITSFSTRPLATIHRIDPRWATSYVTRGRIDAARARWWGQTLSIDQAVLTLRYVRSLHRSGMNISVWTVDSSTDWRRVVSYGVDTLVTNRVVAAKQWCASRTRVRDP